MKPTTLLSACAWIMCSTGAAHSEALPKSAVPLTAEEVTAIYSGHSSKWKGSNAWFAPDMSIKGVFGKKLDSGIYRGKWTASGNEVCMLAEFRDLKTGDTGNTTDCWKWYRDGEKRLWTLWSKRFDGSKVPKNDYYRNESANLVAGDTVFDKIRQAEQQVETPDILLHAGTLAPVAAFALWRDRNVEIARSSNRRAKPAGRLQQGSTVSRRAAAAPMPSTQSSSPHWREMPG